MGKKLFLIKLVHSLIFWFQVFCLGYVLYAGITGTFGVLLAIAIASIMLNGLFLLLNEGRCPLTTLAERHGAVKGSVTDMFLPHSVARNTFRVGIVIFPAELLLLAIRFLTRA